MRCTAASGGPAPQWLRKGGVKGGTVLQDSATLEQCGLVKDMDVWEVRRLRDGILRPARCKHEKSRGGPQRQLFEGVVPPRAPVAARLARCPRASLWSAW